MNGDALTLALRDRLGANLSIGAGAMAILGLVVVGVIIVLAVLIIGASRRRIG